MCAFLLCPQEPSHPRQRNKKHSASPFGAPKKIAGFGSAVISSLLEQMRRIHTITKLMFPSMTNDPLSFSSLNQIPGKLQEAAHHVSTSCVPFTLFRALHGASLNLTKTQVGQGLFFLFSLCSESWSNIPVLPSCLQITRSFLIGVRPSLGL